MKLTLKEIVSGFNSLLVGMRVTLDQFFKPPVTLQYPHETLKMKPRFRGHIELVRDEQTGKPLPSLHSSRWAPLPEPTIRTGVKAMTSAVLELMKK